MHSLLICQYYLYDMTADEKTDQIDITLSDYGQIGSLQSWLMSAAGAQVLRRAGEPGPGEQGALDILTVVGGSSALVAAIQGAS